MTVFEKILSKEIAATIVFENPQVMAIRDIHPQAHVHVLFIHKIKSKDIDEMVSKFPGQAQELLQAICLWTKMQGIDQQGYRIVTNKGPDAGQTVFYTHFHVLAGEPLGSFGR